MPASRCCSHELATTTGNHLGHQSSSECTMCSTHSYGCRQLTPKLHSSAFQGDVQAEAAPSSTHKLLHFCSYGLARTQSMLLVCSTGVHHLPVLTSTCNDDSVVLPGRSRGLGMAKLVNCRIITLRNYQKYIFKGVAIRSYLRADCFSWFS